MLIRFLIAMLLIIIISGTTFYNNDNFKNSVFVLHTYIITYCVYFVNILCTHLSHNNIS